MNGKRWLFVYKIVFYEGEKKMKLHGITYADDFDEAMMNVMRYYGDEDIEKVRIELAQEACSILELPHFITKVLKGEEDDE